MVRTDDLTALAVATGVLQDPPKDLATTDSHLKTIATALLILTCVLVIGHIITTPPAVCMPV